jgi:hypothetical protein
MEVVVELINVIIITTVDKGGKQQPFNRWVCSVSYKKKANEMSSARLSSTPASICATIREEPSNTEYDYYAHRHHRLRTPPLARTHSEPSLITTTLPIRFRYRPRLLFLFAHN